MSWTPLFAREVMTKYHKQGGFNKGPFFGYSLVFTVLEAVSVLTSDRRVLLRHLSVAGRSPSPASAEGLSSATVSYRPFGGDCSC